MRFSIGLVAAALLALAPKPSPLTLPVKDTALSVELLPVVDAGQVRVWIGRTEVPWELLDAFVYEKVDAAQPAGADAVARPSKPYISMDRGFGHAGFPAISVNIDTAQQFCAWLSKRTGRTMRLPTVAELRAICPDDKPGQPTLDQRAWHAGNSGGTTHKVGSSRADAQGFSDLQGNVAEWAIDANGKPVLWGGSFMDAAKDQGRDRVQQPSADWNASDPQMPPSRWWLADGSFIGFRVACEPLPGDNASASDAKPASPATKEPSR